MHRYRTSNGRQRFSGAAASLSGVLTGRQEWHASLARPADLLSMDGCRPGGRRDSRLPRRIVACALRPVHPGEALRDLRMNEIVLERHGITADTALRLARFFGGDAQSWISRQEQYDLRKEEIESARSSRGSSSTNG